jgi:hypothetical protein
MRYTTLTNGIAQSFDNRLLTGNFFKRLRSEFSG